MKITVDRIRSVIEDPQNGHVWSEVIGDIIPPSDGSGNSRIKLKCGCGKIKEVSTNHVLMIRSKSCGCLVGKVHKERAFGTDSDGKKTRLYTAWINMRVRCRNIKNHAYPNYGGRGISVCDEWVESFVTFRDWALNNGYQESLTIDRKDNDGNYCPDNCRWTTHKEQNQNRRSNHFVTIGDKTLCVEEWLRRQGLSHCTFYRRVKRGMSEEAAILTPTRQKQTKINKPK